MCLGSNIYILLVAPFARGLDPLFVPFCIWGNEVTMTINQVKKLRKIVRIKKLAMKETKLFVCTMKKTSVCYKMVLIYLPTIFFHMHTISILRNDIYAYLCIQSFPKQFTDDYLSTHLYGQEARKVFVQHPRYNVEVFLKRANDRWSIIHRRWAKVAKAFNILEGSIFAFRFDSFPDEIHLSIY